MEAVNLGTIRKLKQLNLLINIIFLSLAVLAGTLDFLKNYRISSITSIVIVYILVVLFITMLKYTYFYFNNSGDKITVKYYPIRIIAREYKAIEIPKDQFIGYKLQKAFFGFREEIILVRNIKNKRIEYPPISLMALTKQEKEKIFSALKKRIG